MKISKEAKKLAVDLGLSEIDAYIMDLKAKLYTKSADLIKASKLSHSQIAKRIGTSRSALIESPTKAKIMSLLNFCLNSSLFLKENLQSKLQLSILLRWNLFVPFLAKQIFNYQMIIHWLIKIIFTGLPTLSHFLW